MTCYGSSVPRRVGCAAGIAVCRGTGVDWYRSGQPA